MGPLCRGGRHVSIRCRQVPAIYKAADLIEVDAAYTSQTCHVCGHVAAESCRSQSRFQCVACAFTGNADMNAALNILARGRLDHKRSSRSGGAAGRRGAFSLETPTTRRSNVHCASRFFHPQIALNRVRSRARASWASDFASTDGLFPSARMRSRSVASARSLRQLL